MKYNVAKPAVPEEHMAARKPSITRTRRTKKTPELEPAAPPQGDEFSSTDLIAEHLRVISNTHLTNLVTIFNTRMEEIVNHLAALVEAKSGAPDSSVLDGFVAKLATLEAHVGAMRTNTIEPLLEKVERLEKAVNAPATPGEVAEIVEPAKRRGRPPKVLDTTIQQPAEPAKPAPKTEVVVVCKHIGTLENLQRPGLARCTVCGAVVDVPVTEVRTGDQGDHVIKVTAPAAQQTVAVPAPAPAANNGASKIPTADDVRAVAITFAGKHGKPALAEALKEFGATNLSTLPEENRAGLMAKLQAGI